MTHVKFIQSNQNVYIEYTKHGRINTELYCIATDAATAIKICSALQNQWETNNNFFL